MDEETYWNDLHRRATALRQSSFYLLVAACVSLAFTALVAAATIRRLDEFSDSRPSGDSGLVSFFGLFTSDVRFLDYATTVSSATSTYALVSVVLFATGYVLRALSLIAEVAVVDLDLESDDAAE